MTTIDRIKGSLFGLAYGDALAAAAEFLSVPQILERWPGGPRDLEGDPALITDDTQMAVAVGEGLVAAFERGPTVAAVNEEVARTFSDWFHSSDNTRSPGLTCLGAAARLSQGFPWIECSVIHSKGCGANMRVAPVGLLTLGEDAKTDDGATLSIATLAQSQAAMTHGHPTALAGSELTALAIAWLAEGEEPSNLIERLRAHAEDQRFTYHEAWLDGLWEKQHGADSGAQFMALGWSECARALDRLAVAAGNRDRHTDPCDQTGSAWVAEEALATALLCFLLYEDDPVDALNRAAVTRGDSDSIAAITGAFVGARHGFGAWPESWYERIEGRDRLASLVTSIAEIRR